MSLILEALRKSEAERRRGLTPDVLADMPAAQPANSRRFPVWAWLLPVIVVIAIAFWMSKRSATPPSALPTTTTVPTNDNPVRHAPVPAAALPPVPRLTAPAPAATTPPPQPRSQVPTDANVVNGVAQVTPRPASPTQTPPAVPQAPAMIPSPVPIAVDNPATPATPAPTTTPGDGRVESLSDLTAADRQSLPPLKLSMHLWNPDPAKRFVILDGNRVGEGDRVGDAVIRTISRDGIVLDWRGRQINLPNR